jgi:hypothetical protein
MSQVFVQHLDWPNGSSTLATGGYTAGSGVINLATGTGTIFGSPSPSSPIRVTLMSATTFSQATHYTYTGRSGDQLTGVTVLDGTDQNFLAGDTVETRIYAADFNDAYGILTTLLGLTGLVSVSGGTLAGGIANVAEGGTGLTTLTAHAVLLGEGTSSVGLATIGTAGRVLVDQGVSADPAFAVVSGDGTLAGSGALTVTKTNGVAFAPSATTDTTNAANISSGTLPAARLPTPTASTLGGVEARNSTSHQWINAIPATGVPTSTQPAFTDISGSVAASQLPNPSATTLGGIESYAAVTSQWINAISTSGVPSSTQPGFSDLSGSAAVGQLPVMVASGASHAAGIAPDPGATAGMTHFLREDATWAVPGGGSGTVTSVSVVTANGFAGTVATATTTPAITLTTTATGILVGNGTAISAASNVTIGASSNLNLALQAAPGTPTAGDLWPDSTQIALAPYLGGMVGYVPRGIYSQTALTTLTASGAQSLVTTTGAVGSMSLPAGFFVAGKSLRFIFSGYGTSAASSPGTVIFSWKLGSNVIATTIALSFATNVVNGAYNGYADITCKVGGSSGKLDISGTMFSSTVSTASSLFSNVAMITNGSTAGTQAAQTQISLDLTQAYLLDFQANMSANAVNSLKCGSIKVTEGF